MRHISEIIAGIMAGIKYPDASSIKTSVKPGTVVGNNGELKNAIIIETTVIPSEGEKEIIIKEVKELNA